MTPEKDQEAMTTETTTREKVHVPDLVDPAEHGETAIAPAAKPQQTIPAPEPPKADAKPQAQSMPMKSDQIDQLAVALAKAQLKFDAIVKNQEAEIQSRREGARSFSYDYADLAAVLAIVRPVLAEEGIAVLQLPNNGNGVVTVSTLLVHGTSGQFIRNNLSLETGPIVDPKALGSALTYLRRYALLSIVGVAPEDDDGAAASGERRPDPPKPAERRSSQRPADRTAQSVGSEGSYRRAADADAKAGPEKAAAVRDAVATSSQETKAAPAEIPQSKVVGFIKSVEERGPTAVMVTLEDGYKASCSRAKRKDVVEALERFYKTGAGVELTVEPSSDPSQYPPRIVAASQQLRESGAEG